ncbi:hypothetical protein OROMI_000451 [Orobanche minor]
MHILIKVARSKAENDKLAHVLPAEVEGFNRVQYISYSKACRCSKNCTSQPFQKAKKTRLSSWVIMTTGSSVGEGNFTDPALRASVGMNV